GWGKRNRVHRNEWGECEESPGKRREHRDWQLWLAGQKTLWILFHRCFRRHRLGGRYQRGTDRRHIARCRTEEDARRQLVARWTRGLRPRRAWAQRCLQLLDNAH